MKQISPQGAQILLDAVTGASNNFIAAAQHAIDALQHVRDHATPLDAPVLADLCQAARQLSGTIHGAKFAFDWQVPPTPEWFDHFLDQHLQFRRDQNSFWAERGVYGVLALAPQAEVLELCCGDGFNAFHFYAPFCSRMICVDFDPEAIRHARTYNAAPNITFQEVDIRTGLPGGTFTNIVWDAAIEHFTEEEIAAVTAGIKSRLIPGGILSGHTIVERSDGTKHLDQHEREFSSMADLASFLEPHFANVRVFETIHPTRHNLYFYASDGPVPFDSDWRHGLQTKRP